MQKMTRHFRFYKKGAPFPGQCLLSGEIENLWDLGPIPGTPMTALVSDRALGELADFAGFVSKQKYTNETTELKKQIADLQAKLDASPKLLKELTNGINGLLSTYVADMAVITSTNKPVQSESPSTGIGKPEVDAGATAEAGQATGSSAKPSTKSVSK